MKHIITNLCLLAGISFGTSAFAQTATFNNATRYLTIPSVQAGTSIYSNVVVRLDSFAIISVGGEAPVFSSVAPVSPSAADTCVTANFTIAKYNAISLGMTLDQVTQIIGCKPQLSYRSSSEFQYVWRDINERFIFVNLDSVKMKVIYIGPAGFYY